MKAFVESLSLTKGAILVALVSVGVVWLLCAAFPRTLRAPWVVLVPFIFAYSLYWLPVWLGADASGYDVWKGIVVMWFLAGFFPSAALALILQRRESHGT